MSGGYFDYHDSYLKNEIFNYGCDKNPLEDKIVSEIVLDVFDLLHEFDWYKSGDTCEDDYKQAVLKFKKKWFKQTNETFANIMEESVDDLRRELLDTFEFYV